MCLLNNKPVAQFKMLPEDYDDSHVYFIALETSDSAFAACLFLDVLFILLDGWFCKIP